MYKVTFYGASYFGVSETATVAVETIAEVRAIITSSANVMVEWDSEWGDAVDGFAVTDSLARLIRQPEQAVS